MTKDTINHLMKKLAAAALALSVVIGCLQTPMQVSAKYISGSLTPALTTQKPMAKSGLQSFAKDDKYYYYLQKTDNKEGHLMITRIGYDESVKMKKDYMKLRYFSHGTNLALSTYHGKTYLWTGSDCERGDDRSTTISCFEYKPGTTLSYHSRIRYEIPFNSSEGKATNVYPAISADGKQLCVRHTYKGRQYFEVYELQDGTKINTRRIVRRFSLEKTAGDFQGFDFDDKGLYTIEGSPAKVFAAGVFAPTVIRHFDFTTKKKTRCLVSGMMDMKFREPEGIKVSEEGDIEIMFASLLSSGQYCNTYYVK